MSNKYRLIDCGNKKKLEQFGEYKIIRPCPQAIWDPTNSSEWENYDVEFVRTGEEKGVWNWKGAYYIDEADNLGKYTKANNYKKESGLKKVPKNWMITNDHGLLWQVEPNEFGNIGVFVEHWTYVEALDKILKPKTSILNLFTYSGSNCIYLAKKGHKITAVDSSRNAITTYSNNLDLNGIDREGHKLILEDCLKFIARETRRENKYSCIMIDAPSYGRGTKGELFKIEDNLKDLLVESKKLIEKKGIIFCTLHSPRFTPKILEIFATQLFPSSKVECEEILVPSESGLSIPSGFKLIIQL